VPGESIDPLNDSPAPGVEPLNESHPRPRPTSGCDARPLMPDQGLEPLTESLTDALRAASDECRAYVDDGAPTTEQLNEWAFLMGRAAQAMDKRNGRFNA
jgi:hypothetical protein